MIRSATVDDAEAIARIYRHYIVHTPVTFETEPVDKIEMAKRIEEILSDELPWLVLERAGKVVGYAYANRWKARSAYRQTVETTVYLDIALTRSGHGSVLYRELLEQLRGRGLHVAIGCIALPNPTSVALHEKFGFSSVGCFREVGLKFGQRLDVGYWQLML